MLLLAIAESSEISDFAGENLPSPWLPSPFHPVPRSPPWEEEIPEKSGEKLEGARLSKRTQRLA